MDNRFVQASWDPCWGIDDTRSSVSLPYRPSARQTSQQDGLVEPTRTKGVEGPIQFNSATREITTREMDPQVVMNYTNKIIISWDPFISY